MYKYLKSEMDKYEGHGHEKNKFLANLDRDFHEIVNNKDTLRRCTEKFLDKLIDNMTLGVVFELHREYKTKAYKLDKDIPQVSAEEQTNVYGDIFGHHNFKKNQECVCPNCDRAVAATRFAPHLEACMGMGRSRSRNASRRIANNSKERENPSYSGIASDDEDDVDWSSGDKKRKRKDRNGSKKSKGTPKKNSEAEHIETVNVDVEGDEDDLTNLRDLLQDHSNGSSPADSVSSSGSTKKKDKSKSKKSSRKDRSSPSTSINID